MHKFLLHLCSLWIDMMDNFFITILKNNPGKIYFLDYPPHLSSCFWRSALRILGFFTSARMFYHCRQTKWITNISEHAASQFLDHLSRPSSPSEDLVAGVFEPPEGAQSSVQKLSSLIFWTTSTNCSVLRQNPENEAAAGEPNTDSPQTGQGKLCFTKVWPRCGGNTALPVHPPSNDELRVMSLSK